MYRRTKKQKPGDEKLHDCEENVKFLAQEACVAAKAIEVSTEASLGPFLQLFVLIPTCQFFNQVSDPWNIGFSDLSFSIAVSILTFSWSMTFHHVTKEGSIDFSLHLVPRLALFVSFVMKIASRLFPAIIFGHQTFGSEGFYYLFLCILGHVFLMAIFNIFLSDLTFRGNCTNWRYWCEVVVNSFGCIFVHNNIACFHDVEIEGEDASGSENNSCLLYTSPSPRDS